VEIVRSASRRGWFWGATGFGLVALFVFSGFWAAGGGGEGPVVCLLRRATGVACPACGLTRAAGLAASGRFAESFAAHPLFALVAVEVAAGWWLWGERLRGGGRDLLRFAAPVTLATAALLVLVWIARWATGTLPS
jgi:hypothetical protein